MQQLLDIPLVIRVPDIRGEAQHVSRRRRLDVAVAQVREPVLVAVRVIVVFPAGVFDRLEEMDRLQ